MDRKSHEEISEAIFGKPYTNVHIWIDSKFKNNPGYLHWQYHHHLEAIAEKYGKDTPEYKAALLHIITDWISHWGKVYIPKNKEEVLQALAELGFFGRP